MFVLVLVCEGYSYSKCKNSLGITKLPSVSTFILNDPFSVKTAVYAMGSLVEASFTKKISVQRQVSKVKRKVTVVS